MSEQEGSRHRWPVLSTGGKREITEISWSHLPRAINDGEPAGAEDERILPLGGTETLRSQRKQPGHVWTTDVKGQQRGEGEEASPGTSGLWGPQRSRDHAWQVGANGPHPCKSCAGAPGRRASACGCGGRWLFTEIIKLKGGHPHGQGTPWWLGRRAGEGLRDANSGDKVVPGMQSATVRSVAWQ